MQVTVHFVNGVAETFDLQEEEAKKFFADRRLFFSGDQKKFGGQYSKAEGGMIDLTFSNIMWTETDDMEKPAVRQGVAVVSKETKAPYTPR